MEILGDISQPTPTDGNINYITGQYYADAALCYGNCASHSSFTLGSGSMSGFPGALYKESSNACKVFDQMPSSVYGCTQAQYGFSQIPIAVPSSPGIINPMNAQPIGDHRMHGEISEQYGTSGYACAVIPESNTSAQKLTHEVAMPKVEAIDDLYSVTPHLKGQIIQPQPHVQEMLAQVQANLAAISENLSQDLKHMKQSGERTWDCSKQTAASKPNPPTQEVIKVFDETPTYDVYDDEVSDCSNGFINLLDGNLEQQQDEEGKPYMEQTSKCFTKNSDDFPNLDVKPAPGSELQDLCPSPCVANVSEGENNFWEHHEALLGMHVQPLQLPATVQDFSMFDNKPVYDEEDDGQQHSTLEQQTYEEEKQESEDTPKCLSKASETSSLEVATDFACSNVFDCILEQQHHDDEKPYGCQPLIVTNLYVKRSNQFSVESSMIETSMSDSKLPYTNRTGDRLENVNCTNVLVTPQLKYEQEDILLSGAVIPEALMDIPPSSTQRSYWLGHVLLKLPWDPGDINTRVRGMQMVACNSIRLKSLEAFSEYYSEVFNRDLASNFTAETESSDVVLHDPRMKTSSYMYNQLEISSDFAKPLQLTQGTLSLALQYQLTLSSVPRIWDPGIELLLYKKDAQMQWDPGKDNKKFNDLIPVLCSPRFNAMHYCQIFQKCDAMSSHHYSQQDMNLCGIALWLITFNPP